MNLQHTKWLDNQQLCVRMCACDETTIAKTDGHLHDNKEYIHVFIWQSMVCTRCDNYGGMDNNNKSIYTLIY